MLLFIAALAGALLALIARPDGVSLAMVAGVMASWLFTALVDPAFVPGVLALIEALLTLALLAIATSCFDAGAWTRTGRRAQSVGLVSVAKLAALLIFMAGHIRWPAAALAFNGLFWLQIIIAGGGFDRLAVLAAGRWHQLRRRLLGRHAHGKVA